MKRSRVRAHMYLSASVTPAERLQAGAWKTIYVSSTCRFIKCYIKKKKNITWPGTWDVSTEHTDMCPVPKSVCVCLDGSQTGIPAKEGRLIQRTS